METDSLAKLVQQGTQKVPVQDLGEWQKRWNWTVYTDIRGKVVPAQAFDDVRQAIKECRAGKSKALFVGSEAFAQPACSTAKRTNLGGALGAQPNSSSLGVDITFLLFGLTIITILTPVVGFFCATTVSVPHKHSS